MDGIVDDILITFLSPGNVLPVRETLEGPDLVPDEESVLIGFC
jgi:hypothetical protein